MRSAPRASVSSPKGVENRSFLNISCTDRLMTREELLDAGDGAIVSLQLQVIWADVVVNEQET